MTEPRKGILTPEQEETLDKLMVWKKKAGEAVDGPFIQLLDNQGLERAKQALIKTHPDSEQLLYDIVDILFAGLEQLVPAE